METFSRIEPGQGGYGVVHRSTYSNNPAAVKVYSLTKNTPETSGEDDRFVGRDFYSELKILSKIRHPNFAVLYGVFFTPEKVSFPLVSSVF